MKIKKVKEVRMKLRAKLEDFVEYWASVTDKERSFPTPTHELVHVCPATLPFSARPNRKPYLNFVEYPEYPIEKPEEWGSLFDAREE